MIKLTILNADGSLYWTEHFSSQLDADLWWAEAQTQSDWDATRTPHFEDLTPQPKVLTPEEQWEADLATARAKRAAAYPPLGEFADAYVKLHDGDHAPMEAYAAACLAVKAAIPKPVKPA